MREKIMGIIGRNKKSIGIIMWMSFYAAFAHCNTQRNREVYLENPIVYATEQDFLSDFETEKKKLGLEAVDIFCEEDTNIQGGHSYRRGDGEYKITFNPAHKTKLVLRHELYHIKKYETFSLDDLLNGLTLGQYEEWNATTYSLKE